MRYTVIWMLAGVLFLLSCSRSDTETRFLEYQNAGDKAYVGNNYAEAEKQYRAALAVAEENGPENTLVLIGLRSLAQLYMSQKKDADAESLFQKRIEIAEKISSKEPEKLATMYDDLATLYLLRDRYSEAEPLYKRALALKQEAFGANSPEMAENLKYYAGLLRRIKRNDEAADLEARATAINSSYK